MHSRVAFAGHIGHNLGRRQQNTILFLQHSVAPLYSTAWSPSSCMLRSQARISWSIIYFETSTQHHPTQKNAAIKKQQHQPQILEINYYKREAAATCAGLACIVEYLVMD